MAAQGRAGRRTSGGAWVQSEKWPVVRGRLLEKRICDLGLRINRSPVSPFVEQLLRELEAKDVNYAPAVYLTNSWGCPDKVPAIGIPFYLASPLLQRIEEEATGELEDEQTVMQILRHEAGHAINYAFRLWQEPGWRETFGSFSRPYRDDFRPNPRSRRFVRHIRSTPYGYTYAQKHPDDDFAETFAVWLTPRSGWRRRYRSWPAIQKLKYVDRLMRKICGEQPKCTRGRLIEPVSRLTMPLAEHYGRLAKQQRRTG